MVATSPIANVITATFTMPFTRAARERGVRSGLVLSGCRPAGRTDRRAGSGVDDNPRRIKAVAESGVGSFWAEPERSLDRAKRTSCALRPVPQAAVLTLSAVHRNVA